MAAFRPAASLAVAATLTLAGCPWPEDNPFDPLRCDPPCQGEKRCFEGHCLAAADGGVDRGDGPADARSDAAGPPATWAWAIPFSDAASDGWVRGDRVATGPGGDC